MGKTSIEWTDESINPIVAYLEQPPAGARTRNEGHYCEKVSPGCRGCYSSGMQHRFGLPPFQEQRGRADIKHRLKVDRLEYVFRKKKPTKFFWCDMTDMFGSWVPNEWIAACFGVMAATPQHVHQVLTKRAQRLPDWFGWLEQSLVSNGHGANAARGARWFAWNHIDELRVHDPAQPWRWPLRNVHLGVSCEDQQRADERIPHLLRTPAAVRWVSAEPLLGAIDGAKFIRPMQIVDGYRQVSDGVSGPVPAHLASPGIDWLVVGGESGPRARACDLAWIRSIVVQCKAAGTPVFTKQLGARPIETSAPCGGPGCSTFCPHSVGAIDLASRKGGDASEWPPGEWPRQFPRSAP